MIIIFSDRLLFLTFYPFFPQQDNIFLPSLLLYDINHHFHASTPIRGFLIFLFYLNHLQPFGKEFFFNYASNLKHLQGQPIVGKREQRSRKDWNNLVKLASRSTEGLSAVEMHSILELAMRTIPVKVNSFLPSSACSGPQALLF